jgi:hypothetical protein
MYAIYIFRLTFIPKRLKSIILTEIKINRTTKRQACSMMLRLPSLGYYKLRDISFMLLSLELLRLNACYVNIFKVFFQVAKRCTDSL